MSGKKSPPALYELYHKGKNTRGGLFGRRKKLNIQNAYDIPAVAPQGSKSVGPVKPTGTHPNIELSEPDKQYEDSNVGFEVEYGRITMILPTWLFVMVVLAILTSLLAAYKLGSTSGAGSTDDTVAGEQIKVSDQNDIRLDAEPSPEMLAALNSEPVTGLVKNSEIVDNENLSNANLSISNPAVVDRPARCLIVFGDTNLDGMRYVRDYFSSKGLELEIVKRSSAKGYTLVTKEGFVSTRDQVYSRLKEQILAIGKSYSLNRESGWPRITERTFSSAYPIDTNDLIYNW